jgi:hypothetical protein
VPAAPKAKVQIDPKLTRALRSAGDEGTVDAVLMFQSPKTAPSAKRQSDQLQRQIAHLSSGEAVEANYFPNLGSVAVRTKGRVLKKLLKHPGLSLAALNQQ